MKTSSLRSLFTSLLLSTCFISYVSAQVNTTDSLTLVDLYNNTNGPAWKNHTNWLTAKPVSKWYGITVTANRVTGITLTYNKVSGQLPASLGNLSELTSLELYHNSLQGSLNPVVKLKKLLTLDLSSNAFNGNIPGQVSNLSQLEVLNLSFNKLTGNIPASVCTIQSLLKLYLSNNLLSGSLPNNINNLTFLQFLDVSYNQLSGPLPAGFYELFGLITAQLQHNQFSGKLLNRFSNFWNLITLSLSDNQFSGTIPGTFSQLGKLSYVYLQNNHFSGVIPSLLGFSTGLIQFDLSNNQLTGTLPSTLTNLIKLAEFNVSDNKLSGDFPPQIITMPSLPSVKASGNHLMFKKNINTTTSTNLNSIDISNNNFNFNGLEYIAANVPTPVYVPQAGINIHQHASVLNVSAGGKLSNNTYTWHLVNGGSTEIAADSGFTPSQPGLYYVTVTNKVAAKLTLVSDTVNVTSVNAAAQPQLSVAPNPVQNSLTVYGLNERINAKITVTDVKGYAWVNSFSNKQSTVQFDVSRLNKGSYIISINDGTAIKTIHFIKR